MKIVVTGANGQLGSELREVLTSTNYDVFFLDRKQLPLEHTAIIQDILSMYEPDLIIHCAAYTAVDKAETEVELAFKINHLACEEIAQYCRIHGAKLIAISTDYVFDGTSNVALREEAPIGPINVYGHSKRKGEEAILKWAPESIIIRTSWVYSTFGNNFVKTMIRLMNERDEISVISDQTGSPTYAYDLAKAIELIINSEWKPGIYHFSNEGESTWYDFATTIRDLKGLNCKIIPIPTSSYPTPAKRPKYSLLDKEKIKSTFSMEVPNWKDSLAIMLSKL